MGVAKKKRKALDSENQIQRKDKGKSGVEKAKQLLTTNKTKAMKKRIYSCQAWWCTPLNPALGKQRQAELCEFKASLVYRASSRTAGTTQRNPVSEINK